MLLSLKKQKWPHLLPLLVLIIGVYWRWTRHLPINEQLEGAGPRRRPRVETRPLFFCFKTKNYDDSVMIFSESEEILI